MMRATGRKMVGMGAHVQVMGAKYTGVVGRRLEGGSECVKGTDRTKVD